MGLGLKGREMVEEKESGGEREGERESELEREEKGNDEDAEHAKQRVHSRLLLIASNWIPYSAIFERRCF